VHDTVRVLRCVVDVRLVVLHVLGVHGIKWQKAVNK
jgi:hypothetical protein